MNEEHWCVKCWATKRTLETVHGWICTDCIEVMWNMEIDGALESLQEKGLVEK